jgi:hypothetical protein
MMVKYFIHVLKEARFTRISFRLYQDKIPSCINFIHGIF